MSNRALLSGAIAAIALGAALCVPQVRRALFGGREVLELSELDPAELHDAARDPERPAPIDVLGRYRLDEGEVRRFLPLKGHTQVFDPYCYLRMSPGIHRRVDWPEHPDGEFLIATNELGLRQDRELGSIPAERRVLVVGDSHITGVCNNDETLAARLERELGPPGAVEVANGANGSFGFFHYLGVLERFLELGWKPDVFVVVVYGGNDFAGLVLWHLFHGTQLADLPPAMQEARKNLRGELAAAFGQVLHTAEYMHREDGRETATAARMAREVTLEIQRLCEAEGIELLVAYLPPATALEGQIQSDVIERGMALLDLEPADLARLGELADGYLADLEALGVHALDLREGFRAAPEPLYWQADLHLNVAGQALAAQLIAAALSG